MNRTTHSTPGLTLQEFFEQNRRLLIFLAVFLAGVLGGVLIFTVSHASMAVSYTHLDVYKRQIRRR